MVEAKVKDQGHNFSKLWLANFPHFFTTKMFKMYFVVLMVLIVVVFKIIMNIILKSYTLAADVDYVL